MPVAEKVDVIISNCVINLVPDKKRVFEEAFRVLASNGRLMVSDIVQLKMLPKAMQENLEASAGCISIAELKEKYVELICEGGFKEVKILQEKVYPIDYITSEPETKETTDKLGLTIEQVREAANSIVSISVSALKQ